MKTATLPIKQYEKDNLTESFIHSGLLWKEWRQRRYLFILLLILILQPLVLPAFLQAFGLISNMSVPGFNPWVWAITNVTQDGASNMEGSAIIAVILLAASMVAGERGKGLNFLVSTPVSRRQILMAKWVTGSLTILLSMILLLAYMSTIYSLYPTDIAMNQLLIWAGKTTAALLCLFSLALLSASLCTGILYSAVLTVFFLALPVTVYAIIMFLATKYELLSSYSWLNYFNIINYITNEGWNGGSVSFPLLLIILMLLMVSLLFLLLAVRAFESNPLVRSGEVLLSGNFKELGRWVLVCLFAPLYAAEFADNITWFIIYTILLAIGIYLGVSLLWRAMAWLGLSRQS